MNSLIPSIKNEIIKQIFDMPELKPYLPNYSCDEHRTYIPDIVFLKMEQAQQSLSHIQGSIIDIEQEFLRYQYYITHFSDQQPQSPQSRNSQDLHYEESDDGSEFVIEVSTSSDSETDDNDDCDDQHTRHLKLIIDKLSAFNFDKIKYPAHDEVNAQTQTSSF